MKRDKSGVNFQMEVMNGGKKKAIVGNLGIKNRLF